MERSVLARLGLVLLLLGSLVCTSSRANAQAGSESRNSFKHLVDIGGGHHLNIVCTGTGSPTVVFLQGLGSDITDWRKVREPVAALTRTCFYDRAGFGYSDPPDKPSTADNVTDDLHALLRAAGITGRVVLVGHSLGGLFATLYVDKFKSTVAGLVLVDPSFAGQYNYTVSRKDRDAMPPDVNKWILSMQTCKELAQNDKLSTSDPRDCMPSSRDINGQGLTPQEAEYLTQQFYRPFYYTSVLSEFYNFYPKIGPGTSADGIDGDQERLHKRSFGNLPLEVLTAGTAIHNPKLSEATNEAIRDVWISGHDKLANRSTRGESIMVSNSHHFIQLDQPDRVVEAIRKIVLEARQ